MTVTQAIVPSLARQRSDMLAAKILNEEVGSNATIVFFGRDTHAVEMALGRKVVHFDKTETEAAAEFLSKTPESLLVASVEPLEELREQIENRVALEKMDLGRHVYRAWSLSPPMIRSAERSETTIR
ncbi:hypothetical protein N9Y42_09685, partial [Mariniblastus sp.]|nr:hypothetical protein [Mariniblastus sp.]